MFGHHQDDHSGHQHAQLRRAGKPKDMSTMLTVLQSPDAAKRRHEYARE